VLYGAKGADLTDEIIRQYNNQTPSSSSSSKKKK